MRLRFKPWLQGIIGNIRFAFYPKVAIVLSIVAMIVVDIGLGIWMGHIEDNTALYNTLFAIITGATASFLVSIVIEFSNNYKNNKLAWYELQDYYSAVTNFEMQKQILMGHSAIIRAEKKAVEEFIEAGGILDEDEEKPLDEIQAVWEEITEIIPVFRSVLRDKKAFLSGREIDLLRNIEFEFSTIWNDVKRNVDYILIYNALNHPDMQYLENGFPQNIIDDLPDYIRRHLMTKENEQAIERITDAICSDKFLLKRFMEEYDVSQHGLDVYETLFDEDDIPLEQNISEADELSAFDMDEADMDEATFKASREAIDRVLKREDMPFVSGRISRSCLHIAKYIECLEKYIKKKPYIGFSLKINQNASKESVKELIPNLLYESEKKRLEELLRTQQTKD